jgi:hypothetical protein
MGEELGAVFIKPYKVYRFGRATEDSVGLRSPVSVREVFLTIRDHS